MDWILSTFHIRYILRAQETTGNPCKSTQLHAFRWPTTSGSRGKAGRVWLLILRRRASSLTFDAYMCIHVHALHTVWIHACSNKQSRKTSCLDLFFKFPLSSCIGVRIRVFDILHAFYQSAIRKQSGGHTWKILKGAEIAKGDRYIKQTLQELPFKHIWAVKCALHHSMSNLEMSRFSLCARLRESALSCAPVRPLCGQVFSLKFCKTLNSLVWAELRLIIGASHFPNWFVGTKQGANRVFPSKLQVLVPDILKVQLEAPHCPKPEPKQNKALEQTIKARKRRSHQYTCWQITCR